MDNDDRRFVLIKEYFPVTLCNGRSPDGDLMPKEGREVLFKTSRMDFKDLYDDLHRITPATGLSQILDVMDYISNNCLMPMVALLTCILIGWVVKPQVIIDEVTLGGYKFGRKRLYIVMVKFIAPVLLAALLLQSFGILNV